MAVMQSYQVNTNAEDLSAIITNITPKKTPLLTALQSTKAHNRIHEVQKDTLDVPVANTNAWLEGQDFVSEDQGMPDRVPTYPQIFRRHPHVSGTQMAIKTVGIKDAYAYQVTKKLKEIAMEIEFAAIQGVGGIGDVNTARYMTGALTWISSNALAGADPEGDPLSEDMFNDLMQAAWEKGGDPDHIYCNGALKRQISSFTAGTTKNVAAGDKKLTAVVDIYEGDFGIQRVVAHRYVPAKVFMALEHDLWAFAWLRKTQHEPLPKTGDAVKGMILAEVALECREEKGNAKYTNVKRAPVAAG
jgi:hypothetical protein